MCRGHEEWCIVQKDGTQQASTHRHLDAESAADKGWGTTSTTEKKDISSTGTQMPLLT